MSENTAIPNIALSQLRSFSIEKRAMLIDFLSLRGEIYISGLKKLESLRNEERIKKINEKTFLVVTVIDSYYDESKARIVFITDLIAKDDGQSIVVDFYLSDLFEAKNKKLTQRKPCYRKSDNSNHVPVWTSFRLPNVTIQ